MNTSRKKSKGVTLIELMVVVAIVAILAAIAYPSYRNQIRKSNRAVAKTALMTYAQTMERCFTQNFTYTGCGVITTITNSSTFDSGKNLYAISVAPTPPVATYTVTATAQNSQSDDEECWTFSLTSTNLQTAKTKTNADNNNCWR